MIIGKLITCRVKWKRVSKVKNFTHQAFPLLLSSRCWTIFLSAPLSFAANQPTSPNASLAVQKQRCARSLLSSLVLTIVRALERLFWHHRAIQTSLLHTMHGIMRKKNVKVRGSLQYIFPFLTTLGYMPRPPVSGCLTWWRHALEHKLWPTDWLTDHIVACSKLIRGTQL